TVDVRTRGSAAASPGFLLDDGEADATGHLAHDVDEGEEEDGEDAAGEHADGPDGHGGPEHAVAVEAPVVEADVAEEALKAVDLAGAVGEVPDGDEGAEHDQIEAEEDDDGELEDGPQLDAPDDAGDP